MADTQDGESDRTRVPAPEANKLDRDTSPVSEAVAPDAPTATGGDDVHAAPDPLSRSPTRTFETCDDELARAIREQWTPALVSELRRHAERRARMVRASGRPCPPPRQYARELVNDAHADTWCGDRAWNPKRCSLLDHLRGVITSRTWAEIVAARQNMSLDARPVANDNGGRSGDDRPALVDRLSSSSGDISSVMLPALFARTCDELRRVTNEHDCIAIVRAWELGFFERNEVMDITGLDEVAYRRARVRLFYASGDLPDELRRLFRDYLRSAS